MKNKLDPADVALLQAHAFGKTREFLLAHLEYRPTAAQKKRFTSFLNRRKTHEPVAMIIGRKAFFDIELEVKRGVLVPRPETELLVEVALEMARTGDTEGGSLPRARMSTVGSAGGRTRPRIQVIDVGTGSGVIALTLAKHLPQADIIATDLSSKALSLAKKNARRLGLTRRVRFVKSNLLPPNPWTLEPGTPTIIVANLPYLPTAVWRSTAPDVKNFEPRAALDGGRDGLDAYRDLFKHIKRQFPGPQTLEPAPLTIIIEIDPSQKKILPAVIRRLFPRAHVTFKKDLAGRWRVAVVTPRF